MVELPELGLVWSFSRTIIGIFSGGYDLGGDEDYLLKVEDAAVLLPRRSFF